MAGRKLHQKGSMRVWKKFTDSGNERAYTSGIQVCAHSVNVYLFFKSSRDYEV